MSVRAVDRWGHPSAAAGPPRRRARRSRTAWLALLLSLVALGPTPAPAHHGVASLGVAGLEGPGAPLETSVSATLPQGSWLVLGKLDYARFERGIVDGEPEGDYNAFWMAGLGYGFRPWLSGYVFLPYSEKVDEAGGFDTHGLGDVVVTGVVGFKYDQGLMLVPAGEGLDDLEDWHFTVNAGVTLPTGDPNERDRNGAIDPGKSLGFGKPSLAVGATATRQVSAATTLVIEGSYLWFQEYEYDDGNRFRFGAEARLNGAVVQRLHTDPDHAFRLDGILEANFLRLGRDESFGRGEPATGGDILYAVPGVRLYKDNMSLAIGVKLPVWTRLNEEDQQQGAEGKERYRLVVTLSVLFQ
jgi:hypothetical protein